MSKKILVSVKTYRREFVKVGAVDFPQATNEISMLKKDISLGGVSVGSATIATGSTGSADISVGSTCPVFGCTDSTAANFDPAADTDDGSCDYLGCTNPTALNYDKSATKDNKSCVFGPKDNKYIDEYFYRL